jgi:hypothetical protein
MRISGLIPLLATVLGLAPLPARAEVTLTTRTGALRIEAGRVLGFQATHSDGHPHEWDWTIDEFSNIGHFTSAQGRHRIAWTAPDTLWDRKLHLRATVRGRAGSPADTGVLEITVTPQLPAARDPDPASRRNRWAARSQLSNPGLMDAHEILAPRVLPFGPGVVPAETGAEFSVVINQLVKVGDAVVALSSFHAGQGLVLPLQGAPREFHLHGRLDPRGPDLPAEVFPAMFCERLAPSQDGRFPLLALLRPDHPENSYLVRMDLTGRIEPIGELRTRFAHQPSDRLEGPLDSVTFGQLAALCEDGDGGILLADSWGTLRKVTAGNRVQHLAGRIHETTPLVSRDGRDGATFVAIQALARDPATGTLFVGQADRVRALAPDGEVRTLLGGGPRRGPGDTHLPDPWPGSQRPRLNRLKQMVFQGGRLFILGSRSLLVYDPQGSGLATLALRSADPVAPRYGPLSPFTPYLDPARCAHLDETVHALAGGDQELFLVQGRGLFAVVGSERARFAMARITLPQAAFEVPLAHGGAPREALLGIQGGTTLSPDETLELRAEWSDGVNRQVTWALPEGFTVAEMEGGTIRIRIHGKAVPGRVVIRATEASLSSRAEAPRSAEHAIDVLP